MGSVVAKKTRLENRVRLGLRSSIRRGKLGSLGRSIKRGLGKYSGWSSFKENSDWDKMEKDRWLLVFPVPLLPALVAMSGLVSVGGVVYSKYIKYTKYTKYHGCGSDKDSEDGSLDGGRYSTPI